MMMDRAQDVLKEVKSRIRDTFSIVTALAESTGLSDKVISLARARGFWWTRCASNQVSRQETNYSDPAPSTPTATKGTKSNSDPDPESQETASSPPRYRVSIQPSEERVSAAAAPARKRSSTSKRKRAPATKSRAQGGKGSATASGKEPGRGPKLVLIGDASRSERVRPLRADDSLSGSTYLARIIWALGLAQLEELGPLRPADMARMVMSRSPVNLDPPNIARYIRRTNPATIEIDHKKGSSRYYRLSAEGRALFNRTFCE